MVKGVINLYEEVDMEVNNFAEIWLDIIGYEGLYQVSSLGRVRSGPRFGTKGGILKLKVDQKGYLSIKLSKNGIIKTFRVNRLVAVAFIINQKNKPQVNHKDGIKSNNEIDNLEWCTARENVYHRDNILGKHNRGEAQANSKLTKKSVLQIRQSNLKQKDLAELYSVTQTTISEIQLRKTWKHIR